MITYKIFFLGICLWLSSIYLLNAQSFRAGLLGGGIVSQVGGDNLSGYNQSGLEGGGFVSIGISDKFEGLFQISMVQKGSKKNINADAGDFNYYRMRLNYIQVPVLLAYHLTKKMDAEAGTGIGVLLSSSEEDEYGKISGQQPFKKFEWFVQCGFRYMIFENFFLVIGFENSILPIRNYDHAYSVRVFRDQYSTLLRFSMRFQFKPKAPSS